MEYALGVDVGTSFTAAAIWRLGDQPHQAEVVALGSRTSAVPSVLFLGADGSVLVGEAAERRALTDPDRVVREFKRRIGDDTPVFVGGQPYAAEELAAMMVRWVVGRVTEREGGSPERIAITYPASWGPFKRDLLSKALGAAGLEGLSFLTEPEAAAISYAAQERVEVGTPIAVYDLGGGTFDAAVVRKTNPGCFTVLGSAGGLDQLGGADFDEAVFAHVQAALDEGLDTLHVADSGVLSALARLRRECREAKEALSADTVVSIPVLLPGLSTRVRLVRGEFEEMIRPALQDTVDSLCGAIRSAGLSTAELGAVLLVGGSSRMPLVTQLVSTQLGRPVVMDADPKATISRGAALSTASQISADDTTADPEPDRPPFIPAPRQPAENQESSAGGVTRRRLRDFIVVGSLAGVLLISFAIAAPGGHLSDGSSPAPSLGVQPPLRIPEVRGTDPAPPGGTASAASGTRKKTTEGARAAAAMASPTTTAVPPAPTSTTVPSPASSPSPVPTPTLSPSPSPSPASSPSPTPASSPSPAPNPASHPLPEQAAPLQDFLQTAQGLLKPAWAA